MATLSREQLDLYLERIHLERNMIAEKGILSLSWLLAHQLVYIPFESLSLHYSQDRNISIDPQELFIKLVTKKRGGYCLENNTFFAAVLRTLGFQVASVGCRISMATRGVYDGSWRGISHMANIVTVNGTRYLVDVGFGGTGPSRPLPLHGSGVVMKGLPDQELQLQYLTLPQHSDPSQKVWIYSQRRPSEPWNDVYHFAETEFFPADFEVLNFYNMNLSSFAKTVIAQRFYFQEAQIDGLAGTLQLLRNQLEQRSESGRTIIETYDTEAERLAAFVEHFQIDLAEAERSAVRGRPSELFTANNFHTQS